ncbi:Gfo/Idh/MocA family protein [Pseudarthrobacter sp. DSP2-3-2b1]|uniref:Gfo/Idh/MocA family protein n=1 Tax=Pseudarthrobacter sp. DSP2-3-2b1 TaxID=2804661 RepID=UPI003CEEDCD3
MGTSAGTDAEFQSRNEHPVQAPTPATAPVQTPTSATVPVQAPKAPTSATAPSQAARIALVGVHGFGSHHLRNLERLQAAGVVELVAVADPQPPAPGSVPATAAVHPGLTELLAAEPDPDVIIVATPIQTHAPLGLAALATAADLYLEKPPVASLADFNALCEAAQKSGRSVQIGFQSLGSHALAAIEELVASGAIGTLEGISATGRWVRDRAYYKRSRWAGKRSIDGVDVVDGVATNPLAHAVATALRIAGARTMADVASVETDLYRANDIESDDTSVIRIRTTAGLPVTCALTICATESVEPYVTLQGSEGKAVFHYTEDRLTVTTAAGQSEQVFGRDDLTENLIAHRRDGTALISPLLDSGAFMLVLEAIRTAPLPALIGSEYVQWVGEGDSAHAVVVGIEDALERATRDHATFKELGLAWAR